MIIAAWTRSFEACTRALTYLIKKRLVGQLKKASTK